MLVHKIREHGPVAKYENILHFQYCIFDTTSQGGRVYYVTGNSVLTTYIFKFTAFPTSNIPYLLYTYGIFPTMLISDLADSLVSPRIIFLVSMISLALLLRKFYVLARSSANTSKRRRPPSKNKKNGETVPHHRFADKIYLVPVLSYILMWKHSQPQQ